MYALHVATRIWTTAVWQNNECDVHAQLVCVYVKISSLASSAMYVRVCDASHNV